MHSPKLPKQVCTFLGLIGYYRKLIRNYAKIAKPLTPLTPNKQNARGQQPITILF